MRACFLRFGDAVYDVANALRARALSRGTSEVRIPTIVMIAIPKLWTGVR